MMTNRGKRNLNLIDRHSIPVLDRKGLRHFGVVTGAMFAAIFGLFFPWFLEVSIPSWPWIIFGVLGALGLLAPNSLRPVYYWWMRFAILLSRVTTPIVLGILYYLMVTPMALGMRLLGKDPMNREFVREAGTYRITSEVKSPSDLERPF